MACDEPRSLDEEKCRLMSDDGFVYMMATKVFRGTISLLLVPKMGVEGCSIRSNTYSTFLSLSTAGCNCSFFRYLSQHPTLRPILYSMNQKMQNESRFQRTPPSRASPKVFTAEVSTATYLTNSLFTVGALDEQVKVRRKKILHHSRHPLSKDAPSIHSVFPYEIDLGRANANAIMRPKHTQDPAIRYACGTSCSMGHVLRRTHRVLRSR